MKRVWVIKVIFFALFLLAALPAIRVILSGGIPFWYDPARDLLAAQSNWVKPALIGPPTGIPGIFYGPLWIWILSLALKLSSDPAVIAAVVLTLPYLIFFPLIFWQLRKVLGIEISLAFGLVIFISHREYLTQLWNIYPSALLFLLVFYLIVKLETVRKQFSKYLLLFLLGLSVSALISFHLSLAITVIVAAFCFIAVFYRGIKTMGIFMAGVIIPLLPTLLFELRHGFHQVQLLVSAVVFHSYADLQVFALTGLGKKEILTAFLGILPTNLWLTPMIFSGVLIFGLVLVGREIKAQRFHFTVPQKRGLIFLILTQSLLMTSYLLTRNPVWPYHFISLEVPLLLIVALTLGKTKIFRWAILLFVLVQLAWRIFNLVYLPPPNYYTLATLAAKKQIVEDVFADAGRLPFTWVAYETELVRTNTPDYDYLFAFYSRKLQLPLPDKTSKTAKLVYVIIYSTDPLRKFRFSDLDTPVGATVAGYHLDKEKQYPDGTWVQKKSL